MGNLYFRAKISTAKRVHFRLNKNSRCTNHEKSLHSDACFIIIATLVKVLAWLKEEEEEEEEEEDSVFDNTISGVSRKCVRGERVRDF